MRSRKNHGINRTVSSEWMSQRLCDAKTIIRNHHCDLSGDVVFAIEVRYDFHHYFSSLEKNNSHNTICVHYILRDPPYEYQSLVTLICLHQILHVIHPEWDEDRVYAKCRELARLAGYHNAVSIDNTYYKSERMRLCSRI